MIFTASWRATIPTKEVAIVSISRSAPRGRRGYRTYRPLMPLRWFRDPMPEQEWVAKYETEVLGMLDAGGVVADLESMGVGKPVLLMCWEGPPPDKAWCHRGLVSRWLQREIRLAVPEFGYESCGCGARHPKLPLSLLP